MSAPQANADLKNPTDLSASTIQEGKVVYHTADCVICHGQEGDGKGFYAREVRMSVKDWRNAEYNRSFTDGQLYTIMAKGKGKMPAYWRHNTANEIWLMVDYIRSFSN